MLVAVLLDDVRDRFLAAGAVGTLVVGELHQGHGGVRRPPEGGRALRDGVDLVVVHLAATAAGLAGRRKHLLLRLFQLVHALHDLLLALGQLLQAPDSIAGRGPAEGDGALIGVSCAAARGSWLAILSLLGLVRRLR